MAEHTLRFYFDFFCPYSYIGWEILRQQIRGKDFPVEFLAIGPNPPANKALLGRDLWSDARWEAIAARGKTFGLTIRRPPVQVFNCLPHQGLLSYEGIGLLEFISSIFKGIFTLNLDFSTARQIHLHLQSDGIDARPFGTAQDDQETRKRAEETFLLWGERRIRTIPTLEYGADRIAGVLDKRGVDNFISLFLG